MSNWDVELELVDGKSKKFWRARVEGEELVVNFGRIGTKGQTKTKALGDAAEAKAELDKAAAGKRKKGYAEGDPSSAAAPAPATVAVAPAAPAGPVSLQLDVDGRALTLTMHVEGSEVRTEVVETFPDADNAQAAVQRIRGALLDEGYAESPPK